VCYPAIGAAVTPVRGCWVAAIAAEISPAAVAAVVAVAVVGKGRTPAVCLL